MSSDSLLIAVISGHLCLHSIGIPGEKYSSGVSEIYVRLQNQIASLIYITRK